MIYYDKHKFLEDYGRVEYWDQSSLYCNYLIRHSKEAELGVCIVCKAPITPYCIFIVQWPTEIDNPRGKVPFVYCKDCVIENKVPSLVYQPEFRNKVEETTCLKNTDCYLVHMTRNI
jgi:hypothetical protein